MLKPGLGSLSQLSWSTAPESGKECSSKARSYQPPPAPTTAVLRSNVSAGICLVQGLGSRGARSISEVGVAEAWAGEQVGNVHSPGQAKTQDSPRELLGHAEVNLPLHPRQVQHSAVFVQQVLLRLCQYSQDCFSFQKEVLFSLISECIFPESCVTHKYVEN